MRVLVVIDTEDWILGEIARKWVQYSGDNLRIEHLAADKRGFRSALAQAQYKVDAVHFLSPWEFKGFHQMVWRPCSLTIWHVVNWANMDGMRDQWDLVSTGSKQWAQNIASHFHDEHVLRVPYGLDTKEFQPIANARQEFLAAKQLSPDTIVIGFAGKKSSNEADRKGTDRFADIVRALRSHLDKPLLVRMIGKEWTIDDIPTDLQEITTLEGFIPKSRLPRFYAELDFYLCTSRVEGVPYPVLEAMSCGSIALSTPVGVVPEIIESNRNGVILHDQSMVEDALQAISKLSSNPLTASQMRSAARQNVIEKFDWANVDVPQRLHAIFQASKARHAHRSKSKLAVRYLRSIISPLKHDILLPTHS